MFKSAKKKVSVPSLTEIQRERKRIRRKDYYKQALRGTVAVLVVVAAVAVLIATLFLPIFKYPVIVCRQHWNTTRSCFS